MNLSDYTSKRNGMKILRRIAASAVLLTGLAAPAMAQDILTQTEAETVDIPKGDLFIRDIDEVWTAANGVLENVSILIEDGEIAAIGSDLTAPSDITVVEGAGYTAIPGIVDEHSHYASRATNEGSAPVVPEVRTIDAIDHEDYDIYRALSGGVTTAQILHGSSDPIGGQSAIVKSRWGMDNPLQMLVEGAPRTVKFALGENVTDKGSDDQVRFPASRAGVEQVYVHAFTAAQEYQAAWEAYRENPDEFRVPPRRDIRLETLVDIMEGRIRVHAHSYRADEILMLIDIAERFGFEIDTFTHVLEGYKVADEIAAHGADASTFSDWWHYKPEAFDAIPYNAAILHRHGVVTSLNSDSPWLQTFMVYEANKPVKYGDIPKDEALKMLTLYPAMQLRIDDQVGSIEVGKDGDIVLLNGDPFNTYSRVSKTIVDGIVYFDLARDAELHGIPVRPIAPLQIGAAPPPMVVPSGDAPGEAGTRPWADETENMPSSDVQPLALVGATVHTVSGPEIPNGVVVLQDGLISAVGPASSVTIPAGARTIDLTGQHLYPGMIDPLTQIGMVDVGSVDRAMDAREIGEYNPHVRALTSIHPISAPIDVARANGITAVMSAHTTGTISGTGSVIQLWGDTPEKMAIEDRAALVVDFPSADGDDWEEAKLEGDEIEELLQVFERARLYARANTTRDQPTDPFDIQSRGSDEIFLSAMAPAIRGEMPVFFTGVRTEREIETLLLFLEEVPELDAVIVGGDQAYRFADQLAARNVAVVVGSGLSPTMDEFDPVGAGWRNASILADAGVQIAFSTQSVADVRNLPYHAAKSVAFGLAPEAGLRAVTLGAAEVLGLADQMGSIEVGKRADLIVTNGDPLQIVTDVMRMFIAGDEVSLKSKHTKLYEQYENR
ncbi:MAG TPA: amidohydrolase family protein [Longimicrobiaceae bacterium]|nr:amidohydrolase family protein [Longimicrobiaceae bacterium]